ncbi:MAG: HEAT repeat domain-containing protein [Myxococcota bacterium]
MPPLDDLHAIFDADRSLREAEARLLDRDPNQVADVLHRAVGEAIEMTDRAEATMRLERLADLCAQVPGPAMADALLAILDDEAPSVRVAAGEALLDVAYERYAEVARAVERALDAEKHGTAMDELPYILAEVGEPSALPLIRRFLEHPDADVIAAAIEALAQLGDPAAIPALERFADDERTVTFEEFEEETTSTLGELARDAIDLLS